MRDKFPDVKRGEKVNHAAGRFTAGGVIDFGQKSDRVFVAVC
jgi:hypothetical protein